ncbi:hypothetical protein PMSD_20655 [Paenibacillus macquariensis subsp. defensor]|nr:hypothetical protein PMSD_20655 [Paenibacillus macquariensis subsp. defensor]
MSTEERLKIVGGKLILLTKLQFGNKADPLEKADYFAREVGLDTAVINSAIYAAIDDYTGGKNMITLTVAEAAEKLKISTSTLYDLVKKKQVPHFRIGQKIFFRLEALEDWILSMEQGLT